MSKTSKPSLQKNLKIAKNNGFNRVMGVLSDNLTKTKMSDIKNIKTGLELVKNELNDKKTKPKLIARQEVFCREYLINGFNATRAYQKAYEKNEEQIKTCEANGSELLGRTKVQRFIAELQKESAEKYEITRESILNDLKEIETQAKTSDNLKIRIQVVQERSKLFGLYATIQTKNDTQNIQYLGEDGKPASPPKSIDINLF